MENLVFSKIRRWASAIPGCNTCTPGHTPRPLCLVGFGFLDPRPALVLGQADDPSVPFLDHLLEMGGVAMPQLLDRVDADALEHLGVLRPDTPEVGQVVRYVPLSHRALLPSGRLLTARAYPGRGRRTPDPSGRAVQHLRSDVRTGWLSAFRRAAQAGGE